jgi:hypothetical protein
VLGGLERSLQGGVLVGERAQLEEKGFDDWQAFLRCPRDLNGEDARTDVAHAVGEDDFDFALAFPADPRCLRCGAGGRRGVCRCAVSAPAAGEQQTRAKYHPAGGRSHTAIVMALRGLRHDPPNGWARNSAASWASVLSLRTRPPVEFDEPVISLSTRFELPELPGNWQVVVQELFDEAHKRGSSTEQALNEMLAAMDKPPADDDIPF